MSLEDYEILCLLDGKLNTFKARHKLSNEFYMLQTIDYKKMEQHQKNIILEQIVERKTWNHPNLLKFVDYFDSELAKNIYLVTEYCPNGNLNDITNVCLKEEKYLREESICKILYQILCAIKTTEKFIGQLESNEIFLDYDFNVKLYNFGHKNTKLKDIKIATFGEIFYNLLTLKKINKTEQDMEIKKIQPHYTSQFINLLQNTLKDNSNLMKIIDKVLCNSQILLKTSQWKKDKCFFVTTIKNKSDSSSEITELSETYVIKLQNLRKKETTLQVKEDKLNEKERNLINREKKITLMERTIKEKLTQAELYLKRCREGNKSNSSESKSSLATKISNMDTSFSADCGDSITITSKKINSQIMKPLNTFNRTKSERKIKFKAHSPLKEIDYNRKLRNGKRSAITGNKKLFESMENAENHQILANTSEYKPISWTNENKKYAFDLLRFMNNSENCQSSDIKHTFL